MPIRACPDCSSDRLSFPKTGATAFACEDCGWNGAPNEFANWSAWQEFRVANRASKQVVA
jgi:hypothetical protein